MSFQVSVSPGEVARVGSVPDGVRLVLKDFLSGPAPVGDAPVAEIKLEVLADDTAIADIPPILEHDRDGHLVYWFNTHFTSGLLVRGPASVAIRHGGTEAIRVTIGGHFENRHPVREDTES